MTMDQSKNRTVIGADCHVRGELWLENDLLMMGEVEGTLQVMGTLELPASAKVQGQVMCTSLRLAGHVEAEVLAEGEVELLPGAFLAGKLYTPKLMVHDGATLEADVCVGPRALERARQLQELIPDQETTSDSSPVTPAPGHLTSQTQPSKSEPQGKASSSQVPETTDSDMAMGVDPMRGEPVVSTVRTMPGSLRSTLERPRLPRVIKGGVAGG